MLDAIIPVLGVRVQLPGLFLQRRLGASGQLREEKKEKQRRVEERRHEEKNWRSRDSWSESSETERARPVSNLGHDRASSVDGWLFLLQI